MRTYYIEEKNMEMTYLELRLLLSIECDLKYQKITQLLNYFHQNGFIANLTLCDENIDVFYVNEKPDIMSVTIDMQNGKMRFKVWDGVSVLWLYHIEDVCYALDAGRDSFLEIYNKYAPVTEVLFDFQNRWKTSIFRISYYYLNNEDVDVVYHIVFTEDVKNTKYENKLLSKINKEIIMLGKDITQDLSFRIEHSFNTSCIPCQKAKERQENEERNNE